MIFRAMIFQSALYPKRYTVGKRGAAAKIILIAQTRLQLTYLHEWIYFLANQTSVARLPVILKPELDVNKSMPLPSPTLYDLIYFVLQSGHFADYKRFYKKNSFAKIKIVSIHSNLYLVNYFILTSNSITNNFTYIKQCFRDYILNVTCLLKFRYICLLQTT